jgi:D-psicose/D-tagatose/L-ribulose 3-epimerase
LVKYGIHLFLWTERFDESSLPLIKKAKEMGFDGVEIPMLELDAINIEKTKKELEENGMECTGSLGLSIDTDITSDDETIRRKGIEYLKQCVKVTSELGSDVLSGVIYTAWGKIVGRARTDEEWKRSVEALKEVCQYAKNYGVTLAIEPVNRFETYFLNTAADAIKLVKDVGEPNIKIHLDTFHMNIEEKDFYKPIKEADGQLYHFHCCENDRGVPGTGHVDWKGVFKALSEIGYDRWLVIESFVPEMRKIAASIAIWRKIAPSADAIALDGLKFIKKMAKRYLRK